MVIKRSRARSKPAYIDPLDLAAVFPDGVDHVFRTARSIATLSVPYAQKDDWSDRQALRLSQHPEVGALIGIVSRLQRAKQVWRKEHGRVPCQAAISLYPFFAGKTH